MVAAPPLDPPATDPAERMLRLTNDLFPLCRSITGNGLRQTLRRISHEIPLEIYEVPSGTQVFDWVVPDEWNIQDAYVADSHGRRVIDFQKSNLHVVNYSVPFHGRLDIETLRAKLHTLPDHPDWIPYRTSYYAPDWGFCLRDRDLHELRDSHYDVHIDATMSPGSMTMGEFLVPGNSSREFLISAHTCHPSLANDNLSGIGVACELAKYVASLSERRFTYRFLFLPGTIGTIAWLATHTAVLPHIEGGLVLALLGHNHPLTYKQTESGHRRVDECVLYALKESGLGFDTMPFEPYGYDERQYNSPGIHLPVGCLMRARYAGYPEYHTSADDVSRLSLQRLSESLDVCRRTVDILEQDRCYRNLSPHCEPQLGKRGLYESLGGRSDRQALQQAMLWVLNQANGRTSLLAIAERSGMSFGVLAHAATLLRERTLIEESQGS